MVTDWEALAAEEGRRLVEHWDLTRVNACRLYAEDPRVIPGARHIIRLLCDELERRLTLADIPP